MPRDCFHNWIQTYIECLKNKRKFVLVPVSKRLIDLIQIGSVLRGLGSSLNSSEKMKPSSLAGWTFLFPNNLPADASLVLITKISFIEFSASQFLRVSTTLFSGRWPKAQYIFRIPNWKLMWCQQSSEDYREHSEVFNLSSEVFGSRLM